MSVQKYVKPLPGMTVRWRNGTELPAEGGLVDWTPEVAGRVVNKEIIEADPPPVDRKREKGGAE